MTFEECLRECLMNQELVKEFDRLQGTHLMSLVRDTRAPIVRMIDKATGYQEVLDRQHHEDMQKFITFAYEYIWSRLAIEMIKGEA